MIRSLKISEPKRLRLASLMSFMIEKKAALRGSRVCRLHSRAEPQSAEPRREERGGEHAQRPEMGLGAQNEGAEAHAEMVAARAETKEGLRGEAHAERGAARAGARARASDT